MPSGSTLTLWVHKSVAGVGLGLSAPSQEVVPSTPVSTERRSRAVHALAAADADIHLKGGDVWIYRTEDHLIGHTGTAERPANAPNNRAPTRR